MSDTEDDGRRQNSTVTIRKVKSLLNEDRKEICSELSKSLLSELSEALTKSLSVSLMAGFENIIDKKFAVYDIKIVSLESAIGSNKSAINNLLSDIQELKDTRASQATEIENLKLVNEQLKSNTIGSSADRIHELEERFEERTNRSRQWSFVD